jgi:hypothetical protein
VFVVVCSNASFDEQLLEVETLVAKTVQGLHVLKREPRLILNLQIGHGSGQRSK